MTDPAQPLNAAENVPGMPACTQPAHPTETGQACPKCKQLYGCTCDAMGDGPCPVHARENELQDLWLAAKNGIERLKATCEQQQKQIAELSALYVQARERSATHRCKVCDAKWIQWPDKNWTLASRKCGKCCDNVPMGDQIEPIGLTAELEKLRTLLKEACEDLMQDDHDDESWNRPVRDFRKRCIEAGVKLDIHK